MWNNFTALVPQSALNSKHLQAPMVLPMATKVLLFQLPDPSARQTADNEINVEQFVSQLSDEHHRHTSGRTTTEIGDLNTGSALNAHEKRRYQCQSNKPRLTCNHCDRDGYWLLRVKEKERRSSIVYRSKERENYRLIYERERKKTPCRLPKPEPKAEYQCRARLLSMGADEAGGGRRGRWGRPATGLMPEPTGIED